MEKRRTRRREISIGKIVRVFVLTTLVFILGLMLGEKIGEKKLMIAKQLNEDIKIKIMDINLLTEMLLANPCDNVPALNELTTLLGREEQKIAYLEKEFGKNNKKVIEVKKMYTTLLLKHYFVLKMIKEKCEENITTILFFYSNQEPYIKECEEQGYVLSYIKKHKPNVFVYAIDINLDLAIVKALIDRHNVTTTPTIIVNEYKYEGFVSKEDLFEIV